MTRQRRNASSLAMTMPARPPPMTIAERSGILPNSTTPECAIVNWQFPRFDPLDQGIVHSITATEDRISYTASANGLEEHNDRRHHSVADRLPFRRGASP